MSGLAGARAVLGVWLELWQVVQSSHKVHGAMTASDTSPGFIPVA